MKQTKPTLLSDGTAVEELVNPLTREVQMRTLSDEEIYQIELQKVFGKTWLLLGLTSEIAKPGDNPGQHDDGKVGLVLLYPRIAQGQNLVGRGRKPHYAAPVQDAGRVACFALGRPRRRHVQQQPAQRAVRRRAVRAGTR